MLLIAMMELMNGLHLCYNFHVTQMHTHIWVYVWLVCLQL